MSTPLAFVISVTDEKGIPQADAMIKIAAGTASGTFFTDVTGQAVGSFSGTTGITASYTATSKYNNKLASGSFTTADTNTLSITVTERVLADENSRTGYPINAYLKTIGGKNVNENNPVPFYDAKSPTPLDIRYDADDSAPTYIGLNYGSPNASTTAETWTVLKFTYSSGNVTRIQRVDNKQWAERGVLF